MYKRDELQTIRESMNHKNKQELQDFYNHLLVRNKPKKCEKVLRLIIQYYHITGKNLYEKPTIEIRDKFLAAINNSNYKDSYKREIKIYLKLWLKWRWKDFDLLEDFPALELNHSEKVSEKDLLTEKEIELMLTREKHLKWQTILSILYETGCRPEELLNLKWEQIKFNNDITDITFYTKKKSSIKTRIFPVKASTTYLKKWQLKNTANKDDYVFTGKENKPVSSQGLNFHLKQLGKSCGLTKNVFPYLFRFTKATEFYDGNKLDDRSSASLLGHSVNMAGRYHKISNKTAREKLLKLISDKEEMPQGTNFEDVMTLMRFMFPPILKKMPKDKPIPQDIQKIVDKLFNDDKMTLK